MTRLTYVPDRIIDHNGIADGATVYVYRSGTTTPIPIYSDSVMTVPLANPFTVAAGAAFPDVFYDSSVSIKLRIISSIDGTITEEDPYTPLSVSLTYPSSIWINVKNYGAKGDGVTDDTTAFRAAIAYLDTLSISGQYTNRGGTLFVPKGHYILSDELKPEAAIEIYGESTLLGGGSILEWTGSSRHGIYIQGYDGVLHHAMGSSIHNLHLKGWYTGTRSAQHAIYVNGQVEIEDIYCENWPGIAVYGFADTSTLNGNINVSTFRNIYAQFCDLTLKLQGADTNACIVEHIQSQVNRLGCYWDWSFLGNFSFGIYAENCGQDINFRSRCEKNGHIYVVAYGQEAWCSTNSPSGTTTHNQGWLYLMEGATNFYTATWVTGQTWYFTSPISIGPPDNGNTRGRAESCYVEGGMNPIILGPLASCTTTTDSVIWCDADLSTHHGTSHGGTWHSNYETLIFGNSITIPGLITQQGIRQELGATSGVAADYDMNFHCTNFNVRLNATRHDSDGTPHTMGSLIWFNGASFYDAVSGVHLRYNGTDVAATTSTGLDIPTGKILSVNGTKVIGAQGSAVADAAALTSVNATNAAAAPTQTEFNNFVAEFNKLRTDLGATRTQLNLALAALRASTGHGLIA